MSTEVETTEEVVENTPTPVDETLARLMEQMGYGHEQMQKAKAKWMIFSDPDAGKSVFLGQAPNSIVVDVEKGLTSLKNHPELVDLSKIKILPYKNFLQVEALVQKMNEGFFPEVETLSIDSMSELHKRGLAEITEREWRKNPGIRNRYKAETEDHTENNEHIRRLVSSLRDLDKNIILTCHARYLQNKDGSLKIIPDFSDKLANALMGIVDLVGYMQVTEQNGKKIRTMRVHTNGAVHCKSRYKTLPDVITDPTFDILWDAHVKQTELDNE